MAITWKIVLFSGSRTWTDLPEMASTVEEVFLRYRDNLFIIEGGATGLDQMVREYATGRSLPHAIIPAPWDGYGRAAGPVRNKWLARFRPIESHLFYTDPEHKSRGTLQMEHTLEKARLPYTVHGPNG